MKFINDAFYVVHWR